MIIFIFPSLNQYKVLTNNLLSVINVQINLESYYSSEICFDPKMEILDYFRFIYLNYVISKSIRANISVGSCFEVHHWLKVRGYIFHPNINANEDLES